MSDRLKAPFPWSGGKGRWCDEINARLGTDVGTFAEPFAGSLAVLLSREPARREVVCDTSSLLVNAWRAMAWDPLAMAYWADWPTFHDDLIARRLWLGAWVRENAARVQEDADFYDVKAGAWWMWAMSHAIRGNADMGLSSRPSLQANPGAGYGIQSQRGVPTMRGAVVGGSTGVAAQRTGGFSGGGSIGKCVPSMEGPVGVSAHKPDNRVPKMLPERARGGSGVDVNRYEKPDTRRPALGSPFSNGQCVQAHRTGDAGGLPAPVRWLPWFETLAARLKQVVVLNRGWRSACTPAALAARAGSEVAVLLDPPYITNGRAKIYEQDGDPDEVNRTARESYEWALEHGNEYRLAYCHTAGSFEFPGDWELMTRKYGGTNQDTRTQDAIAFSPRCLRPQERGLLF